MTITDFAKLFPQFHHFAPEDVTFMQYSSFQRPLRWETERKVYLEEPTEKQVSILSSLGFKIQNGRVLQK